MRAFTTIRGPNGLLTTLEHGDLIGRLRRSALVCDDPRVSEAHAMVSLRGDRLKLMALRRRLYVEGQAISEVVLEEGLVIELLPGGPRLVVDEVVLPTTVLAVEAAGLARHVLAGVASLQTRPIARLIPGYVPGADAVIWGEGADWTLAKPDGVTHTLAPECEVAVGGLSLRFIEVPLMESAVVGTIGVPGPLRVVIGYDSVEVHASQGVALLGGVLARLVSELAEFDGPVSWEVVAAEVWGKDIDRTLLRARMDVALWRIRKRLRETGSREDLVVTTGAGHVQLLLHDGDSLKI